MTTTTTTTKPQVATTTMTTTTMLQVTTMTTTTTTAITMTTTTTTTTTTEDSSPTYCDDLSMVGCLVKVALAGLRHTPEVWEEAACRLERGFLGDEVALQPGSSI